MKIWKNILKALNKIKWGADKEIEKLDDESIKAIPIKSIRGGMAGTCLEIRTW